VRLQAQSWLMAVQAGRIEEFEGGAVKGVGAYAVGLSKGRPFAVSRHCRHLRGDLASGSVNRDGCLVCPLHGSTYDVESGRMVRGPQGRFAKIPGLGRANKALTRVFPLRRGRVVERDGVLFVD
jgi:nitrite reductase/ring-hydroxylating ferredoxin subunit